MLGGTPVSGDRYPSRYAHEIEVMGIPSKKASCHVGAATWVEYSLDGVCAKTISCHLRIIDAPLTPSNANPVLLYMREALNPPLEVRVTVQEFSSLFRFSFRFKRSTRFWCIFSASFSYRSRSSFAVRLSLIP
jgi:hypothetical protein